MGLRLNRERTRVEGELVLVAPGGVRPPRRVWLRRLFHVIDRVHRLSRVSRRDAARLDRMERRPAGVVGTPDDSQLSLERLSTDGRTIIAGRTVAGNSNIWLFNAQRGAPHRLTFGVTDGPAALSPDGSRVVYQAEGPRDGSVVYERRSDGTGDETILLEESVNEWHNRRTGLATGAHPVSSPDDDRHRSVGAPSRW